MSEEITGETGEITGVETTMANVDPLVESKPELQFSDIVPEEYKDKPWVQDVKDINGLFKMTTDLKSKLGERPAGIPQEDATPEQKAAFNKAFGVPDSPDGYELSEPAEGAEEFQKGIRQMFLDAGVSKTQAAKLDKAFNELVLGMAPDPAKLDAEFDQMALDTFGERKDKALENAKILLNSNVPEAFKDHINNLGNKELIVMASVLDQIQQKYIAEDSLPQSGGSATPAMSAEDARAKGRQLIASEAYQNSFHPDHARVVEEVRRIYGT